MTVKHGGDVRRKIVQILKFLRVAVAVFFKIEMFNRK